MGFVTLMVDYQSVECCGLAGALAIQDVAPGSVTVALKTVAGEVQHDEHQHKNTDEGEEELDAYGSLVASLLLYFTSWVMGSALRGKPSLT